MRISFGSVCSGIEAASVAWEPLGWRAAWFSEIEPFLCAVLAHHYPGVDNLGDMTSIGARVLAGDVEAPDVLCGGTPCQSFSLAGLRRSLDDARGNLSLEFIRIADAIDDVRRAAGQPPAWILWENVPGVLSTADNAFGAFLGGLGGCESAIPAPVAGWPSAGVVAGPGRVVAWRVLDAQHFGVAQRRKRVFVLALGGARGWAAADALLPISDRMRWHPAPRRKAGQEAACSAACGVDPAGVAHSLRGEGFDASEDGTGRGTPIIATAGTLRSTDGGCDVDHAQAGHIVAFGGNRTSGPIDVSPALNACHTASGRQDFETEALLVHAFDARQSNVIQYGDKSDPLDTDGHSVGVLAFDTTQVTSAANYSNPQPGDPCHPLAAGAHAPAIASAGLVRRLTPTECERLQGFPDGYTAIPWRGKPADQCPDGPRYKALGNSWAVPVVRWIGERIDARLKAIVTPDDEASDT